MAPMPLTFAGGLLMGLASSLHCAGMCGAIASSLLMTFDPGAGPAARAQTHFAAEGGRVLIYVVSGALLGGVGAAFYGAFDHAAPICLALGGGGGPRLDRHVGRRLCALAGARRPLHGSDHWRPASSALFRRSERRRPPSSPA